MDEVKVVVAHSERATLRVGHVFLKVDADQARIDVEVEAMSLAPVPTPEVLWRKPPVLAIAALPGATLGRLGGPSTGSPAAWAAAGAAIRKLHVRVLALGSNPDDQERGRRIYRRFKALTDAYGSRLQLIIADNDTAPLPDDAFSTIELDYTHPMVPGVAHPGPGHTTRTEDEYQA